MHRFSELYFEALEPNWPMIELMRELGAGGRSMALLTNNVREWEPRWRAMLPVDEIFETVVDSAFVGCRKPDPEIYGITLERIGLEAAECLFVDDVADNCATARDLGHGRGPLPAQRPGDDRDPRGARVVRAGCAPAGAGRMGQSTA